MHSNVQGFSVFMEAPPFPLLWFASGVYSSSRWHHCPGCSRENAVWGYCIESLNCKPAFHHRTLSLIPYLSCSCSGVVPDLASLPCGCKFALADRRICEHDVVCLQKLSTAMPPCRRSSAAERGKTWNGKAKARKTQVTGTRTVTSPLSAAGFIHSFISHYLIICTIPHFWGHISCSG